MSNWKRLDPWFYPPDFVGATLRTKYAEGIVTDADIFGCTVGGMGQLTTPWHTTSKCWVDIDSLPEGFESGSILDDDPPHPGRCSQDEWGPNQKANQALIDGYNPPV